MSIFTKVVPTVPLQRTAVVGILILLSTKVLVAGTIDFENVPQTYWYWAGNQNLGSYWQGVTFGPDAKILEDQIYGYNPGSYPQHSGHAVMFTNSASYIDAILDVPVNNVSLWYTSNHSDIFLEAYDSSDVLVNSAFGFGNVGTSSFLQVSSGSSNIKRVRIHDSGNLFVIDDFSAPSISGLPAAVPEPGSLTLLGVAAAMGLLPLLRSQL